MNDLYKTSFHYLLVKDPERSPPCALGARIVKELKQQDLFDIEPTWNVIVVGTIYCLFLP